MSWWIHDKIWENEETSLPFNQCETKIGMNPGLVAEYDETNHLVVFLCLEMLCSIHRAVCYLVSIVCACVCVQRLFVASTHNDFQLPLFTDTFFLLLKMSTKCATFIPIWWDVFHQIQFKHLISPKAMCSPTILMSYRIYYASIHGYHLRHPLAYDWWIWIMIMIHVMISTSRYFSLMGYIGHK